MDKHDVSGRWRGIYSYDATGASNSFDAELFDHAGRITGETSEASDFLDDIDPIQRAFLDGSRSGDVIAFVKCYDELHRVGDPVAYDGTISEDGDEIAGRWTIHGTWSGRFLMIRTSQHESAVQQTGVTVS